MWDENSAMKEYHDNGVWLFENSFVKNAYCINELGL